MRRNTKIWKGKRPTAREEENEEVEVEVEGVKVKPVSRVSLLTKFEYESGEFNASLEDEFTLGYERYNHL